MPYCTYCHTIPYATYCKGYLYHLEACRLTFERKQEREESRATLKELERLKVAERLHKLQKEQSEQRLKEAERLLKEEREKATKRRPDEEVEGRPEKRFRKEEQHQQVIINNYTYIGKISIAQQLYLDYPKNDNTDHVIQEARSFDIKTIKSVQDLDRLVGHIQDLNGKEIERCLGASDKQAKSQALSFLADVVRTVRTRLQQEAPSQLEVIEAAEEFEKECLADKQRLSSPTVEDI